MSDWTIPRRENDAVLWPSNVHRVALLLMMVQGVGVGGEHACLHLLLILNDDFTASAVVLWAFTFDVDEHDGSRMMRHEMRCNDCDGFG